MARTAKDKTEDCGWNAFVIIFTLFLSPLTIGVFFGCGKTLAINIVLWILGIIPGRCRKSNYFNFYCGFNFKNDN